MTPAFAPVDSPPEDESRRFDPADAVVTMLDDRRLEDVTTVPLTVSVCTAVTTVTCVVGVTTGVVVLVTGSVVVVVGVTVGVVGVVVLVGVVVVGWFGVDTDTGAVVVTTGLDTVTAAIATEPTTRLREAGGVRGTDRPAASVQRGVKAFASVPRAVGRREKRIAEAMRAICVRDDAGGR